MTRFRWYPWGLEPERLWTANGAEYDVRSARARAFDEGRQNARGTPRRPFLHFTMYAVPAAVARANGFDPVPLDQCRELGAAELPEARLIERRRYPSSPGGSGRASGPCSSR